MSEKRNEHDQALMLRQQMEQHQAGESKENKEHGALPPRAQFHKNKRKKTKMKLSFPLIRLLLLLFLIIVIVALSSPYWLL